MENTEGKYRKYDIATFIIMVVGLALFLLTPLFIRWFHFDSDLPGLFIFLVGLAMNIVGHIVRFIFKKVRSRGQAH